MKEWKDYSKISSEVDKNLHRICRTSIHWMNYLKEHGPDAARKLIHSFYHEQAEEKLIQSKNLRNFVKKLLDLLNSKYQHLKVIFDIEN